MRIAPLVGCVAVMLSWLGHPSPASAQTDEIEVYDAAIVPIGTFNITLHNNFTPSGNTAANFPGGIVPDHSLNGVAEWAYGIAPWLEGGLYFPLYSITRDGSVLYNGIKLRALFVTPDAAKREFFYGVNFEFSINSRHWDESRFTSEVRPIIGWHLHPVDIIINPILDTSYDGVKNLDFAPATRVAYNFSPKWAIAAEEYADYGPLRQFYAGNGQVHQLYGVVNHSTKFLDVEAGVGFGLTGASDKLTLKLILSRDLN